VPATPDGWGDEFPWMEEPRGGNSFQAFFLAVSLILRRAGLQIIVLMTLLSLLQLGLQTPGWLMNAATALTVTNPGQYDWLLVAAGLFGLAWIPVSLILTFTASALQLSLYRVARIAAFVPEEMVGFGPAFRQLGKRFGWNLLGLVVLTVGVMLGIIACIIPAFALAFFLMPFPYLLAVGVPFLESFSASFRLVMQNLLLVFAYLAFAMTLWLLWFVLNMTVVLLLNLAMPAWGPLVGSMLSASVGLLIAMPGFFFHAALMVSMESTTWGIPMGIDDEIDG